ncbi:hypothetical protein Pan216_20810 [Planctomycetes bacterium Pan216]|uniref:Uncharacterized protein n=1 Tax=Kolteria novifilia TaxID=2527975 RepID=A0A518B2L4_9BACT|nr:hypothetical protein Pan216_20810 [Planctomycetes bacterium Pan216]
MGVSVANNSTLLTPIPTARRYVSIRRNWSDDWTYIPFLEAIESVESAAPEISSADVLYRFGRIIREGDTSASSYLPVDLRNYYLKIAFQHPYTDPQDAWLGIVTETQYVLDSPDARGDQQIKAYGFGHLLDQQVIRTATVEEQGTARTVSWVPIFNRPHMRGTSLLGNRSTDPIDGNYRFSRNGETWNAKQVIELILAEHAPGPFTWELTGQTEPLEQIEQIWDLGGQTVWGALNTLINRRFGLAFFIEPQDGAETVAIRVATTVGQTLSAGAMTLPANPDQISFTVPATFPWTHLVGAIPFRHSTTNLYDKITFRGERIKVCATWTFADGTLFEHWPSTLQDEYNAAAGDDDEEANALFRSQETYASVYTRYRVPYLWDWKVGNGDGSQFAAIAFRANDDGSIEPDAESDEARLWTFQKVFQRETLLRYNVDYSTIPATDNNEEGTEPEFRPLMVFVLDDTDGDAHEADDNYHYVDKLGEDIEGATSVSVRPLDKEMGFELGVSPQHYFANGHFDDADAARVQPEFDYEALLVTATIEVDERQRVTLDGLAENPHETSRELVVEVPGAEYWVIAPWTVWDLDDDGSLLRTQATYRVIRNDLAKLEAYAVAWGAWYLIGRQAVQIPLMTLGLWCRMGAFLTHISSIWGNEPIRTIVTSRRLIYDVSADQPMAVIETGWGSIDYAPEPLL